VCRDPHFNLVLHCQNLDNRFGFPVRVCALGMGTLARIVLSIMYTFSKTTCNAGFMYSGNGAGTSDPRPNDGTNMTEVLFEGKALTS